MLDARVRVARKRLGSVRTRTAPKAAELRHVARAGLDTAAARLGAGRVGTKAIHNAIHGAVVRVAIARLGAVGAGLAAVQHWLRHVSRVALKSAAARLCARGKTTKVAHNAIHGAVVRVAGARFGAVGAGHAAV